MPSILNGTRLKEKWIKLHDENWSKKSYRFVKLYHPIGSLPAVDEFIDVDVGVVLSCSRTPSTARFHNWRLRNRLPLEFPLLIGLFGDDKDFLGWRIDEVVFERAKNNL
jgi:hypothetical protein